MVPVSSLHQKPTTSGLQNRQGYTAIVNRFLGYFTKNSIAMKFATPVLSCLLIFFYHVTVLGQQEPFDAETAMSKNCISLEKISPENTYKNRRQIMTSCSNEDFMTRLSPYDLTCAEILIDYFHCDICFNQIENSLTSYDGSTFYFDSDAPTEITKECLSLIANMRMGSLEHSKFLEIMNAEHAD